VRVTQLGCGGDHPGRVMTSSPGPDILKFLGTASSTSENPAPGGIGMADTQHYEVVFAIVEGGAKR